MNQNSLIKFIENTPPLSGLLKWVESEFLRQNRNDPGHGIAHSMRTALWAIRLGSGFRTEAAVATALLHDLVNPPKNSPQRKLASELSAVRSREILEQFGFTGAELDDICSAIRTHSFSRGEEPVSNLGRAFQDADRLEALGAIGLYRTISTGVQTGCELFHEQDPWAQTREPDDSRYTVDHFFLKLLKLSSTMKTEAGRIEAERRADFLKQFLRQLESEIGA